MQRRIYREFVAATSERIKRRSPRCRVAVNWAYSLMMPEEPTAAVDQLSGDTGNEVGELSMQAHWYDSQPKPFDLMTSVFYRDQKRDFHLKPREQMEQELAIIVANGGRHNTWDNPTLGSGLVAERMRFVGEVVAPFLRARRAEGQREYFPGTYPHWRIWNIPSAPVCRVQLRLPERPSEVRLQPQNTVLDGWQYENGCLRLEIPGFAIHQLVVLRIDKKK